MSTWYRQKRIDDIDILLCERSDRSEQAVEEIEPMMKPYRSRGTTWDYRSASALIYEAFRLHNIPLELYKVADSGRPYIAEGQGDISVSHSGHYTVVAITDDPDLSIGIDIEEIERARKRNVLGIAKRFFIEEEYEKVRDAENSAIEFLRLWTYKEAYMKAGREPLSATFKVAGHRMSCERPFETPALIGCFLADYVPLRRIRAKARLEQLQAMD